MNLNDISNARLISQNIAGSKCNTVKDIVGRMGAMQAQDYNMAKWAIGVRLPTSTDRAIEESFIKGEILRTHVLRPTLHFVSADDIYWMLELTLPHIKSSLRSRHKELELTEAVYKKSNAVFEKALAGGQHLMRQELTDALKKAKIFIDSSRAYHLILIAELDGILCSGIPKDNEQTYALLTERVPRQKILNRETALTNLVKRYFSSHGPATLQDFVWWSGLPVADAKKGLEIAKPDIISEPIESKVYFYSGSFSFSDTGNDSVYLLPAFDEFIISYKDRSMSLPFNDHHKAVSSNGVFRPVIVVNGRVTGIWKRTIKKNTILIETHFFQLADNNIKNLIEKEAVAYGHFLNQKTEIIFK